jgi:hypothetical protein
MAASSNNKSFKRTIYDLKVASSPVFVKAKNAGPHPTNMNAPDTLRFVRTTDCLSYRNAMTAISSGICEIRWRNKDIKEQSHEK